MAEEAIMEAWDGAMEWEPRLPVPGALPEDPTDEIRAIAKAYLGTATPLMRVAEFVGGRADQLVAVLPDEIERRLGEIAAAALRQAYDVARGSRAPRGWLRPLLAAAEGDRWHRWAGTFSGAIGGAAGLAGALLELPVSTTLILRSIQEIAAAYGEDPGEEEVRRQCLAVFTMGGPLPEDDSIETGFWAARAGLTQVPVQSLINAAANRFGIVVGQKLAAQAAPVLGAAGGAVLNHAFITYFQTMAHIHFRLRQLGRLHGAERVQGAFLEEVRRGRGGRVATR
ncbi:MAG TPA: EcsC family protein [Paracoccaceae bacterium]|nr:EcsC family protein [Paracoccaceae bacterium]